jgi:amino acid transporter
VGRNRRSIVESALARERLSLWAVLFFVLSMLAPLTAIGGITTTTFAVTGQITIPATLLVVGLVLLVFSVGYIAMANRVNNAGAFYALVAHGLGRPFGVAAGAVAWVSYSLLLVALYGGFGFAAHTYLQAWWNITLPWYVPAYTVAAVVMVLGTRRIHLTGKILVWLGAAEVVVVGLLAAAGFLTPAGGHISTAALNPKPLLSLQAVTAGALFAPALLQYVGFESGPVFSEGAQRRGRTLAVSTAAVVVASMLIYTLTAWAMPVHYSDGAVVDAATKAQGPDLLFNMGGPILGTIGRGLFLSSMFAAMLTFHNASARYLFAFGRDHVLPAPLGKVNRHDAVATASLVMSVLSFLVITAYVLGGWDPLTQMLFWLGTAGGFGVLILVALTSVAVIGFFAQDRQGVDRVRAFILPALSLLGLGWMVYQVAVNFGPLLGVTLGSPDSWVTTFFPALFAGAALIGLMGAGLIRLRGRDGYLNIGTAFEPATPQTAAPTMAQAGAR